MPFERLMKEITRRTKVVAIDPAAAAISRLLGAASSIAPQQ
jgi:hypothetical protein